MGEFREFLKILKDEFQVVKIEEEISTKYEASKIMKNHDKDVIIFENIKESDMKVISGICNTREKLPVHYLLKYQISVTG